MNLVNIGLDVTDIFCDFGNICENLIDLVEGSPVSKVFIIRL